MRRRSSICPAFEKFITGGNETADELAKTEKKEQCWMEGLWRRHEQARSSTKEKKFSQPCSMQPAFIAW